MSKALIWLQNYATKMAVIVAVLGSILSFTYYLGSELASRAKESQMVDLRTYKALESIQLEFKERISRLEQQLFLVIESYDKRFESLKLDEIDIEKLGQKQLLHRIESLEKNLIEIRKSVPPASDKLSEKLNQLEDSIVSIRNSINPSNPEEILRTVRLQDNVVKLSEKLMNLEESLQKRHSDFENAMRRELDKNDRTFTSVIIFMVTIVITVALSFFRGRKAKDDD